MIKTLKIFAYLILLLTVLILSFYASLGFIVSKNQDVIRRHIDESLPSEFSYNNLTVDTSFTKGLTIHLKDFNYKDFGVEVFSASDVSANVGIIESIKSNKIYINKFYVNDSKVVINESLKLDSSAEKSSDFILSNKVDFFNTSIVVDGVAIKPIPEIRSKKTADNHYHLDILKDGERVESKIYFNDEDISFNIVLSSAYLSLSNWLDKDGLELRLLNADLKFNANNMDLESSSVSSLVTYSYANNNKLSADLSFKLVGDFEKVEIDITDGYISMPDLYSNAVYIDKGNLVASYTDKVLQVESLALSQGDYNYPVVNGSIKLFNDEVNINLQDKGEDTAIPVDIAKLIVPDVLLPEVTSWLNSSLVSGDLYNNSFKYSSGSYSWNTSLRNIAIDYDTEWPKIGSSSGELQLTEKDIVIRLNRGEISEGDLKNTIAHIVFDGSEELKVSGEIEMPLQKAFQFLKNSPLDIDLSDAISFPTTTGSSYTNISLLIPLGGSGDIQTNGSVSIKNGSFDITGKSKFLVDNLEAKVNFEQDYVYSKDMKFRFDGEPSTGNFSSKSGSKEVGFNIDSFLKPEILAKIDSFFDSGTIAGRAPYNLKLYVNSSEKLGALRYELKSELKGISLDLGIYKKKSSESLESYVYLIDDHNNLSLSAHAKDLFDANLIDTGGGWGGHISLGGSLRADKGDAQRLLISGDIKKFAFSGQSKFELSDKIKPIKLYVKSKVFEFGDFMFDNVWLMYDQEENENKVILEGEDINGYFAIEDKENIKLIFEKLSLHKGNNSKPDHKFLNDKISTISSVEFISNNFIYDNIDLGKLRIDAIYKEKGFDVSILLQQPNSALQMNGTWIEPGKKAQTSAVGGNWRISDFGNLISVLGLNKDLSGGDGFVSTYLSWPGAIFNPDKEHISGDINLQLSNGRITTVDPGLGKILGLLSIEQIARRIKLDFSDVLNKGLTYDSLILEGKISDGVLSVLKLSIYSPAANIFVTGDVYLKDQKLKLIMEIMPKVSDTLPVAAAVAAGNPAVGAAIWVVDKVVSSNNASSGGVTGSKYKYWVAGTLSAPEVTKFEQLNEKK